MRAFLLGVLVVVASAVSADAATIAGQVQDGGGTGMAGQVYLYAPTAKGWGIQQTVTTPANGNYSFSGLAGGVAYRIFVRSVGESNAADRWYDSAAPNSNGWIGEDADELVLASAGSVITGINVRMPIQGGIDGQVRNMGGSYLAGMWVRAQWRNDFRYHHNDLTKGSPRLGFYSMRGLVADSYMFIVYDPSAGYETKIFPGPYSVTSGSNLSLGDFVLEPMQPDAREPNNTPGQALSNVDASVLYQQPPQPFVTQGALVGGNDIDWYCFDAMAGDHFRLVTDTNLSVLGQTQEHPWIDPVVGWWSNGGATLDAWDDDTAQGLNPDLEVWVTSAGKHCAVVTMYGDTSWVGTGHPSAGRYTLHIEMLNRRPLLDLSVNGAPTPAPPASLVYNETDTVAIALAYSDPDQQALAASVAITDALGAPVAEGALGTSGASGATFTWTTSAAAATVSPYTLVFSVSDGALDAVRVVVIDVIDGAAGNLPPPVPVPSAPLPGSAVNDMTPSLVVGTGEDGDGDLYAVEFEVHYGDQLGVPEQSATVAAVILSGSVGVTSFEAAAIPEGTLVFWRARANDGNAANAYSAWSAWQSFTVDAENAPPPAPELQKPGDGELVLSRRPTLEALTVVDPDGDPVVYRYEVASDEGFTAVLVQSDAIAATGAPLTAWQVTIDLQWDTAYYARVAASDDRGGESGFGPVSSFRIKPSTLPAAPEFVDLDCGALVFSAAPPAAVRLHPVVDPDGDDVSLEVSVVDADAQVYASGTAVQGASGSTEVVLAGSGLPEDVALFFRARAIDSQGGTGFSTCAFWQNLENAAPGETTIESPEDGASVSVASTAFIVRARLGADPEVDGGVPGAWTTLAYCVATTPESCPLDTSEWQRLDPTEIADGVGEISVESSGATLTIQVCTMDEGFVCGPKASAAYTVTVAGASRRCGCGSLGETSGALLLLAVGWLRLRRREPKRLSCP